MTQQPPDPVQQEVLGALARWVVTEFPTDAGWDGLHLQLRPLRDEVPFRVIEVRGEERRSRVGRLTPDQPPHTIARRLQDLGARPGEGTWIEASVSLAATGWPTPSFTVTGRFNRDVEPTPWREGETPLDATDLVHHLTRYPRRADAVPSWMAERIQAAGLAVPGPADTPEPAAAPTAPPAPGTVAVSASPDVGELPRPEVLDVVVDRDGPVLPDGTRPGRRRLRLGGSLGLLDVLETAGVPLPFVDDRGTWIVRHGESRDSGQMLAVVEQGPGASTGAVPDARIHLLTEARPADLLDDSGRLALYYCSVPGDLQVVLDSARLGEVAPPPEPPAPPDNEPVRAAVAEFAADPSPQRMLHVLRQVLGGRLVVDATGSQLPEPGSRTPELRLITLTAPDSTRALGAFTNNNALVAFRSKAGGEQPERVTGVAQPGVRLLELFRRAEELQWLIVDPGGPSCAIGRKEIDFALSAPSAAAVKDVLAREHSAQELVAALGEPGASLFIAHTEVEGRTGPVLVRDQNDDKPVLLAFTSPAEVAAYNTAFGVRRLPVGAILQLVLANRAKALVLNPSGPRAVLPSAQVWHALGNPDLPRAADGRDGGA
ncbi:SseB family protein [Georgenia sp. H159]|uniref:SseB family protein n=1 Tax=Georgenia sp. H159 TaxID=3076115 RepID=UPI002D778DD4|nr:SseB family protein [Georgenia sp. H159]